ncbi:TPA: hypothetical protein QH957_002294 [Enterobacter bugandensis]|nr:hypothetical protein [Enterobacter bugandensis]
MTLPTRQPFRATRSTRHSGILNDGISLDEKLNFPADALAPAPISGPEDNMLKAEKKDENLNLTLQLLNGPDAPSDLSFLSLEVGGHAYDIGQIAELRDAASPDTLNIPFTAAQRGSSDGHRTLRYVILLYPSNGKLYGPMQGYTLDFVAAGDPALARPEPFDQSIITDGLTSDKLKIDDEGNAYLDTYLRGYTHMASGDRITGYINGVVSHRTLIVKETGEQLPFPFYRSDIESATDDGDVSFTYSVMDRAGNVSAISEPLKLSVLLKGEITDLAAPLVPEHDGEDDKLIDDADARPSVNVLIPGNPSIKAGDNVELSWGSFKLTRSTISEEEEGQDPLLDLNVEFSSVVADWLAGSGGNDSIVNTPVKYTVYRGASNVPAGNSPANNVAVNMYLPAGPEIGLEIKKLLAPVISSDNVIDVEESKQDSDVMIPWLNADGIAYMKAGDSVRVMYGNQEPLIYTVSPDDISAQKNLSILLSNQAITNEGAGSVNVSYNVTRNITGGGSNSSASPVTEVTVVTADVLPGNGTLPAGRFDPVNRFGAVGFQEVVYKTVTFIIPAYTNMAAGDVITLDFWLAKGLEHINGEEKIASTVHTITQTVQSSDVNKDVILVIEKKYLEASRTQSCHAEPEYTVKNSHDSVKSKTEVTMVDSQGEIPPARHQ